jgi:beta-lactam-binding protein with PASTA domain/D-alanine-D-alanine ligase-like ATP-grasp enzyme
MKIKVGIFFGGSSRQRESSFASGRACFAHLDRYLFEPVPFFVDARGQFLQLDWKLLFQESLHAFYPPREYRPPARHPFPVYEESLHGLPTEELDWIARQTAKAVPASELPQWINFALIALEGEDIQHASLQSVLESLHIPFSGSDAATCKRLVTPAVLMDSLQKKGIPTPVCMGIDPEQIHVEELSLHSLSQQLGFPFQVFPAGDASRARELDHTSSTDDLREATRVASYQERIDLNRWNAWSLFDRIEHIHFVADLQNGIGFPLKASIGNSHTLIAHPEELLNYLNLQAHQLDNEGKVCFLKSMLPPQPLLFSQKIMGEAFACVAIRGDDGTPRVTLPLKTTGEPANRAFETELSYRIQQLCAQAFEACSCQAFAVISGRVDVRDVVYVEHIAPFAAFAPGKALFEAGAQEDLSPTAWLTVLIRCSLRERMQAWPSEHSVRSLLVHLDTLQAQRPARQRIALLYPYDHARPLDYIAPIIAHLESEGLYEAIPCPIHRMGAGTGFYALSPKAFWGDAPPNHALPLTQLPTLADTAVLNAMPVMERVAVTRELERMRFPFTGPNAGAAGVCSHKKQSIDVLQRNAQIPVYSQLLLRAQDFEVDPVGCLDRLESRFSYPLTGDLPEDVPDFYPLVLHDRIALDAFVRFRFRPRDAEGSAFRRILRLPSDQHVPAGDSILFREILSPGHTSQQLVLLNVTVVCLLDEEGNMYCQSFSPSLRKPPVPQPLSDPPNPAHWEALARQTAEKACRQLNLYGLGSIDLCIRISEDAQAEAIVEQIHPNPGWEQGGLLETQILHQGMFPGTLWRQLIYNCQERERWRNLQKVAQSEYLAAKYSEKPLISTQTTLEEFNESSKTDDAMEENTAPPSPQPSRFRPDLPATGIAALIRDALWEIWFFISSTIFLKNLAALAIFTLSLYGLVTIGLRLYTHHGQSEKVEKYLDMSVREARRKARTRSFGVVVNDSVYVVGKAPGLILDQIPKPGSDIKKNRNIYLTVSSATPPEVPLPDLTGGNDDFEQFKRKLERLGLKVRIRDKEFNAELEENTILYLVFEGRRISSADLKRGFKAPKGSTIDCIVSIRNTGQVDVPSLVCLTYEEATFLLSSSQLTLGNVIAPGEERNGLYVYRQEPDFDPTLKLDVGASVNLYLSETKPPGCGEQE